MTNAKKKGNAGENKWANWLKANGINAFRNSSSGGGINKSDVHNDIDANFEVKTVKRINLKEAWKQSVRDATLVHTTPYLVIHFDGMPENDWLMVMSNQDWLDLVIGERPEITSHEEPKLKYALQRLKTEIGTVSKYLPK